MRNRRDFLKIFGSTVGAAALAVGMGVGGLKANTPAPVVPGLVPPQKGRVREFHGPEVDGEEKWIGGEEDTFDSWAEAWSAMSGRPNKYAAPKVDVKEFEITISSDYRQKMVDDVFDDSPLLKHLQQSANDAANQMMDNMNRDLYATTDGTSDPAVLTTTVMQDAYDAISEFKNE